MLIIYHAECLDGFGAAYAAWYALGDSATYHPAKYGEELPDCTDKDVYFLDFSAPKDKMLQIARVAKSVTVLDHHKTAEADLTELLRDNVIRGEFNMRRSGCILAWQHFNYDIPPPMVLQYIEDRDLWKFELESTRSICAALFSYPQTFEFWHDNIIGCETSLLIEGGAILRQHNRQIDLLKNNANLEYLGSWCVPIVNANYMFASDLGNILSEGHPFAAVWYEANGRRYYSLRSQKGSTDVSIVAKQFGGGGHENAAGFSVEI